MKKNRYNSYSPDIPGMTWSQGDLILVGALPWGHYFLYALGNVIAQGTKDQIPVALFAPWDDSSRIRRLLIQMQVGQSVFECGKFSSGDFQDYPVYIDDSPHLTISRLVSEIFRLVEEKGIQAVIVNRLQDIDGRLLDDETREKELNAVLRILKALAKSMSIVIIVTSELSEHSKKGRCLPTSRDILDVTEAEKHCDQIILLHPFDLLHDKYKMVLPFGHPFYHGEYGEQVLNVEFDSDKCYFKKAAAPFEENEVLPEEAEKPMYKWRQSASSGEWEFEFLDSEGMLWTLVLESMVEDEKQYYQITAHNLPYEEILLDDFVNLDDVELVKAIALEKARERFPEVEIPDKSEE